MATEIVKTIRASGGDYTTLSAWEAALPASLVTADEQHTAVCYNDWPSGLNDSVVISGSTTDATRYIKVTVAAGHRHDGTTGHTGFYLKGDKGSNDRFFKSSVAYTQLEWLDVEHTRNSNGAGAIESYQSHCSVTNCIGKCATTSLTAYALAVAGVTNTESEWPVVENCLAINAQVGFRNQTDATRLRAKYYNCVAIGCGTGFPGAATVPGTAINCVAHDCTTGFTTGWLAGSGYNASSDTTATTIFSNSVSGIVDADFVDATGGDFHLASGSALIGAGYNLYGTFDLDIDGDIRPSSGAWDIGFDHYVAAGGQAAALSGAQATASAGTTLVDRSATIAGAQATTATGTLAVSKSGAIAGAAAVASAGTLSNSKQISLTGSAVTSQAGLIATEGSLSAQLTGEAATTSAGTLAHSKTVALAGASAATLAGSLSTTKTVAVSGNQVTTSTGTVSPSEILNVTVALSGSATAVQAGTFTLSRVRALSGDSSVAAAGALTGDRSLAISGAAAAVASGTIARTQSVNLAGSTVSAAYGTFNLLRSEGLSGSLVALSAGSITATVDTSRVVGLSGSSVAVVASSMSVSGAVTVGGLTVTTSVGAVSITLKTVAASSRSVQKESLQTSVTQSGTRAATYHST